MSTKLKPNHAKDALVVQDGEMPIEHLDNPPTCPIHNATMEARRAKSGPWAGKRFFACPHFWTSGCRYTVQISENGTWFVPDKINTGTTLSDSLPIVDISPDDNIIVGIREITGINAGKIRRERVQASVAAAAMGRLQIVEVWINKTRVHLKSLEKLREY